MLVLYFSRCSYRVPAAAPESPACSPLHPATARSKSGIPTPLDLCAPLPLTPTRYVAGVWLDVPRCVCVCVNGAFEEKRRSTHGQHDRILVADLPRRLCVHCHHVIYFSCLALFLPCRCSRWIGTSTTKTSLYLARSIEHCVSGCVSLCAFMCICMRAGACFVTAGACSLPARAYSLPVCVCILLVALVHVAMHPVCAVSRVPQLRCCGVLSPASIVVHYSLPPGHAFTACRLCQPLTLFA